jgi:hypothetical protein
VDARLTTHRERLPARASLGDPEPGCLLARQPVRRTGTNQVGKQRSTKLGGDGAMNRSVERARRRALRSSKTRFVDVVDLASLDEEVARLQADGFTIVRAEVDYTVLERAHPPSGALIIALVMLGILPALLYLAFRQKTSIIVRLSLAPERSGPGTEAP